MNTLLSSVILAAGLLAAPIAFAQTTPVTATCKDGTSFSGTSRSGACRGHQGVASWGTPAATSTAPAAAPGIAPANPPATRTATTTTTPATPPASIPAKEAPGSVAAKVGAPGQVWVNSATKVYHCAGDRYYGKTKAGEFMPLAAAQAAGDRPAAGKACTS